MLSHIETVKIAATDLVTSATSVATLSSNEHSDATVKEHNHTAFEPHHITSEDRIGTWLTKSSEHQESESASCTSTESTRRDSIFSDEETALMSPTSEAESFMPLPLRTSKTIAPSTGSRDRGSITSEHSSIRAKQFQDDRDFNVVLSAMGKWEKSAQAKILKGDLAGAQQDLRSALDCRDLLMSDFANNRELVVLQKLVEIGGRHLERLQYDESEHLFKFAIDRAGHMSNEISDSLKRDIVGKACAIALTKLESDDLFLFDKFSEIARLYRSNILDANLRMKTLDDFALQAATKACEVVAQKLEVDDHDLEACDQLSRIALQQAHHLYRSSTNGLEATLQNFQLPQIANEVVEENIDQRRFGKAESLAEQLIQYARRLPSERIYEADLGRTHFNLAYSCYAQKTDEKLDKAERTLYTSEEWQGNDAHLVHATSYLLAQIYWKKGNLEGAENCCWTALKGRVELYGEDHESYLEVVDLFVRILKARGANDEASLHAIQLTPEYRRKSATQWCAMHACYESKEEVLKRATVGGYEEAIKILIQEGVACSDLLRQAASTGDLEAAQLLLAAGVLRFGEFDHSARKPASDHPIALADQNGHSAILRLLLQNAQMIEDCAATYGLHWAVREQRVTAVAALLDLGVRPDNLVDGTSLLHVVAENAWLSILNELLRVRPDLQIADAKGSTPLHIAVLGGHQSIVEALLEAGADIEYKKGPSTPLQLAIDKRKVSVVRRLLDRGASPLVKADIGNHSAVNALHQAVISNDKPMVEELLNHHPNLIGTKTSEDRTGLHLALMECGYQMARLLIERGIDVNVRTSMGNTAYDLACRRASRDRDFEKLLASKMSPKPSKFKFGLNGTLLY